MLHSLDFSLLFLWCLSRFFPMITIEEIRSFIFFPGGPVMYAYLCTFWRIFNLWRHLFENSELKPVCDFIRLVIENKCFGYELFYSVAVLYPDLQIRWGVGGVKGAGGRPDPASWLKLLGSKQFSRVFVFNVASSRLPNTKQSQQNLLKWCTEKM